MRSIEAPARAVARRRPGARAKSRAAGLSIASNATLIVLKIAAGAVTGSIAILTEAVHSAIDLWPRWSRYFSVRKAEEPPDPSRTRTATRRWRTSPPRSRGC